MKNLYFAACICLLAYHSSAPRQSPDSILLKLAIEKNEDKKVNWCQRRKPLSSWKKRTMKNKNSKQ